jgi:hypothetical protein
VATIPLHLTPRSQSPVLSTPAPRRGSGRRHRRRPRSAH